MPAMERSAAGLADRLPAAGDAGLDAHCSRAPGWDNVYLTTGAGKKGVLLSPGMGKATADLITPGDYGATHRGMFAGALSGSGWAGNLEGSSGLALYL